MHEGAAVPLPAAAAGAAEEAAAAAATEAAAPSEAAAQAPPTAHWSVGDNLVVLCEQDEADPFWIATAITEEDYVKQDDDDKWMSIRWLEFSTVCEEGEVYKVGYNDNVQKGSILCKITLAPAPGGGFMLTQQERHRIMAIILDPTAYKSGGNALEIQRIMAKAKLDNGKTQYLVHWKGFSERQSTWESESTLRSTNASLLSKFDGAECKLIVTFSGGQSGSASFKPSPPKKRRVQKKPPSKTGARSTKAAIKVGVNAGTDAGLGPVTEAIEPVAAVQPMDVAPSPGATAGQQTAKANKPRGRKKSALDKLRTQGPLGWAAVNRPLQTTPGAKKTGRKPGPKPKTTAPPAPSTLPGAGLNPYQ
eukprot:TRINITY_DN4165_c0_g1_i2.p1 TRINITY_DN4165_c0_g1~~TRINITY_DN4165_c0_g1_i2.p1  ORF type:complete len:375 (-),score=78.79 TRINITY_DN4165_c0_g1_i2:773-1861(-)